ncbi:hypothetical protein EC912_109122 [Luteibacter rhizovicinus]|uniref:Uncharacterized protein n=1 Tax=Luteibacter rhizovicinus TaxID=242606 RepID=A0A4R3YHS5_9GAMM|nr:hypothetical protein [Luteibacter rhizovicinus]TCV91887.1 hypothetical protein EC912_109122 [Luteibacter rhizovicinus]
MKIAIAAALLLAAPFSAHAACAAKDFTVDGFNVKLAQGSGQPRFTMKGQLTNKCGEAAAAQIRIDAKDSTGKIIQSKQGWPAGTSNIAPGQNVDFDLGRLFRYQPDMSDYTVTVVDVKAW